MIDQIINDIKPLTYAKFREIFHKHFSNFENYPKKLDEEIFKQLFEAAEIANFTKAERAAYEESLKHYRDMRNVINTAREEGRIAGRIEGRISVEVAQKMKKNGESIDKIIEYTQLTKEQIQNL